MDLDSEIRRIERDKSHGASWLSRAALEVLKTIAQTNQSENTHQLLGEMSEAGWRLAATRPSMAPITNLVARFLYEIKGLSSAPLPLFRRLASEKASTLSESSVRSMAMTAEKAAELIQGRRTILTYSYSSTVLEALSRCSGVMVIVPESRPLFEGRRLAENLAERGGRTTLIIDAAMAHFAREADAVLVGADSVLIDGSVINKVGTFLAALAAADAGIPFYAACETSKFDVRSYLGKRPVLEEGDPAEVAEVLPNVEVRNPYFEVIPAHHVTHVVTERGILNGDAIRFQMKKMSRYVKPMLEMGK